MDVLQTGLEDLLDHEKQKKKLHDETCITNMKQNHQNISHKIASRQGDHAKLRVNIIL